MPNRDPEAKREYHRTYYLGRQESLKAAATGRYHSDAEGERRKRRQYRLDHPEWNLLRSARTRVRAKSSQIEFTITEADVVIPEFCPYLGIKLQPGTDGKQCDSSPSLDRIDNAKGYVPGNVEVISYAANRAKSSLTAEQLLTFAESVIRRLTPLAGVSELEVR